MKSFSLPNGINLIITSTITIWHEIHLVITVINFVAKLDLFQ
jgi:hypothetical protein